MALVEVLKATKRHGLNEEAEVPPFVLESGCEGAGLCLEAS